MSEKEAAEVEIAYKLFLNVCQTEGKIVLGSPQELAKGVATRNWIFGTYAKCLEAVRNPKPDTE